MNVDNNIPSRCGIYLCVAMRRYAVTQLRKLKSREVLIDHNSLELQALILLPNSER